jgi:hypothetical protein
VTTTSQETLAGHAGGKKHTNKVKATLAREAAAAAPPEAEPSSSSGATAAEEGDAKKRKRVGGEAQGDDAAAAATGEAPKAIKWKKLIAAELGASDSGKLSVKRLTKALVGKVKGTAAAAGQTDAQLGATLLAAVEGSSKFALADKQVTLA